jgi:hypothetical protein
LSAAAQVRSGFRGELMAPIVCSIEVERSPDEVFGYVTDPSRFVEWQENVVSGKMAETGSPKVGARCLTVRRIGLAERPITSAITHVDPPKTWGIHGIDGPLRAIVAVTVTPLTGKRSEVTIQIDFEGHGIAKLLVPLVVRRQARNEMPKNMRRLKERLEARGGRRNVERRNVGAEEA